MTQTKLGSLIEACMNVAIGFFISLGLAAIVYPIMGHSFTFGENLTITFIFTAASILRGYAVRRWFNKKMHEAALKLSGELK